MKGSIIDGEDTGKHANLRHIFNILVFVVIFLFSILFSVIGFLSVNLLTNINQNIIDMKTEVKGLQENDTNIN
jgi:hypothetical protein